MHDHTLDEPAGAPDLAPWRSSAAALVDHVAVAAGLVVVAALVTTAPMPSLRLLVAVALARVASPWLRHGLPHERAGAGERTYGVVRRRLLGDGRWEVEAADGARYEVSTPLGYPRHLPLAVGSAVVLRRWPDGTARLERRSPASIDPLLQVG